MNAGGHGSDMAASVTAVTVADLTVAPTEPDRPVTERRSLEQMAYGYRRSSIGPADLVLDARFVARPGDAEEARRTIREIVTLEARTSARWAERRLGVHQSRG